MSRIALGWLAALGAGLVVVLAFEIAPGGSTPPEVAPLRAAPAAGSAAGAPEIGKDNAQVASILARPLFDRSRRPAGASEPVAGVLRLTGVVVGPSGREAIFEPVAGGKPLVVYEGERVNGALVRVIVPGAVLMVDANGAHLISPAYQPGAAVRPGSTARAGAPR